MRSTPRYTSRKVYIFSCGDHWCDCGGEHATYKRSEAEEGSRQGYESIREKWEILDRDDNQIIADSFTRAAAKRITVALNRE